MLKWDGKLAVFNGLSRGRTVLRQNVIQVIFLGGGVEIKFHFVVKCNSILG